MKQESIPSFFAERITHWAVTAGSRPALLNENNLAITYQNLLGCASALQKGWSRLGLCRDLPVLIYVPDRSAKALCLASLLYSGLAGLTIGQRVRPGEMRKMARQLSGQALIAPRALLQEFEAEEIFDFEFNGIEFSTIALPPPETSSQGEAAWHLMTSGSTGRSKIARISSKSLIERALGEISLFQIREGDWILNPLSFSHDLGLNQLLTCLLQGATLKVMPPSLPADFARVLREDPIRGVTGTPLLWATGLLRMENLKPFAYDGYLTISGGQLAPEKRRQLRDIFPRARLILTYGQTETFRTFAEDRQEKIFANACGRVIAGVRAVLVNEAGQACGPGEAGELIHYGAGQMIEYLGDADLSSQKITAGDFGRGIRTGDYFRQLPEGEYEFVGRRDDMIKRMDYRVYISEIQHDLMESGLISDVCVMNVKGKNRFGYDGKLVAWIEMIADRPVSENQIMRYCRQNLPFHKIPDEFHFIDSLPRTVSEKVDRQRLVAGLQGAER